MKPSAFHACCVMLLVMAASNAPAQPEAAPAIVQFESRTGTVKFDHQRHAQLPEVACTDCHHTGKGPQTGGDCRGCHPAQKQKAAGNMTSREAFHKQCINCHKAREKEGQRAGPTKACSGCHKK